MSTIHFLVQAKISTLPFFPFPRAPHPPNSWTVFLRLAPLLHSPCYIHTASLICDVPVTERGYSTRRLFTIHPAPMAAFLKPKLTYFRKQNLDFSGHLTFATPHSTPRFRHQLPRMIFKASYKLLMYHRAIVISPH